MQVNNVLVISASKDVELAIRSSGSMTPSGRRYTFSDVYLLYHYRLGIISRIEQEFAQIKDVHLIHMHIFSVTTTKAYHLGLTYSIESMESLRCKVLIEMELWLVPYFLVEIKSPEVS